MRNQLHFGAFTCIEQIMQQKERRALDRCFDGLLRDLDPSPSFLHSLYAENVLTEEQVDRISVSTIML